MAIKSLVLSCLAAILAFGPIRTAVAEGSDRVKVTIFLYHHIKPGHSSFNVQPKNFEAQVKYLKENGYSFITVRDLADVILRGKALPPKPVILTFDDTRRSQYVNAFPIMKKYGAVATLYISPTIVGFKNAISWTELREMQDYGISIGSHGLSHPRMRMISPAQLKRELTVSRQMLEEKMDRPVLDVAYPYGSVNAKVMEATAAAGYETGRGVRPGTWHSRNTIFSLQCIDTTDSLDWMIKALKSYK